MQPQENKVLFMYYVSKAKEFKDTDKELFNFYMNKAEAVKQEIDKEKNENVVTELKK